MAGLFDENVFGFEHGAEGVALTFAVATAGRVVTVGAAFGADIVAPRVSEEGGV